MSILGALVGGAVQAGLGAVNNIWAEQSQKEARKENYMYGEMSANEADKRTRALYSDIYSPQALMQQYKDAGLSPSMMFGGTPGQGGMSGAQGTGAAGPGTPYMPISMMEGVQMANIAAQTEKTKAETKNIQQDTVLKKLQETWNDMQNKEKSIEFNLTTTYLTDKDGNNLNLFELANNCYNYDKFMEEARTRAKNNNMEETLLQMGTEAGQKVMRQIFMNANRFDRDIKVLSEEGVSAEFQQKIMQCLNEKGFAEQNASTAIKQLEAAGEAADLTKEQKSAFNNILERLRKTSSTTADIVIVASMILNQAASHWSGMGTTVVKQK